MELICRILILQCHTRKRKIAVPLLKQMNMHCYSIKNHDDELLKNSSKIPAFLLRPLNSMLNFEVDRLTIQKLEYEMDCTDYPIDYNF